MIAEYKKKTNIGIGIAFAVWILGGILIGIFSESPTEEDFAVIQGLGSIPFVYGLWCYSKGKGYHGAWGLLGIFCCFGLIILVLFPDKHKTVNTEKQVVKEPVQQVISVKQVSKQTKILLLLISVIPLMAGLVSLIVYGYHSQLIFLKYIAIISALFWAACLLPIMLPIVIPVISKAYKFITRIFKAFCIFFGWLTGKKAMRIERGFRRITLFISIVVGLAAGFLCYSLQYSDIQSRRFQYNRYKEDYENIAYFWRIWDANGWAAGHKGIVRYLEKNPYSASFKLLDGKTIYLNTQDVFPGVDKFTSLLPLDEDEIEKKVQNAKLIAIQRARNNFEKHKHWGDNTPPMVVAKMLASASFVGFVGFSIIWLLFFLTRWLVLGFFGETDKSNRTINSK